MGHVDDIVRNWFGQSAGELCIGGIPVSRLAQEYGTPLFIYDQSVMRTQYARLRAALPDEFEIYYSVKANPNREVIRQFLDAGCGLEIASVGEYHHARAVGCPPGKVIFAGPGKLVSELECVLESGIGELHAESLLELDRIAAISKKLGRPADISIRVNPTAEAQGGAMRMGGKPAPFGIDEEMLDYVLDRLASLSWVRLRGIHLFSGTQILDAGILLTQYRKGVEIANRVALRLKEPLRTIDFGGGLGIPYFPHEHGLDLGALAVGLRELISEMRQLPSLAEAGLIVEPGRFLVGESGVYVARVTDVKVSRGKKFVILDGGMNHHLAASGNLGQTIKRNYPMAVLNRLGAAGVEMVDVVGPLCTPLDTLARSIELPAVEVGDLIGVFQSGAYGRSASPLGFLSHLAPPEILVEHGGAARLIAARGSIQPC